MQRLRTAEHARERLDRRADDVVQRLLRGERHAGRLHVGAHEQRALVLRAVRVAHLARPDPAGRAQLRDLLEEVDLRVEEEGQPRRERVDVDAALDRLLHVGEAVLERERELLRRGRAGLADVVARDRDGVPARELLGGPLDHVAQQAHGRVDREAPLLLRDVLLEDVGLDRAAQAVGGHACVLGGDDVEGEHHRGGRVDRHGDAHLADVDPLEEALHVVEHVDGDALAADLAERHRVVGVVAHERRHVERGRQPGLPVVEQVVEALVGLLRGAEARELPHRPQPPAVHRLVDAAGVGELAGSPDGVGRREVLLGVERPSAARRRACRAVRRMR